MRLTAELVEHAVQRMNPIAEREIILRGYKIPAIENTGTLRDAFDCIDLCDNEIKVLGNFTRSPRVTMVLACNNQISKIDANLGGALPRLATLSLANNSIDSFAEIDNLRACDHLESLSLLNNPLCQSPHYRPYLIAKAPPSLKLLDFRKIKQVERAEALKLFPPDGPALVDMTKPLQPPPRPPSKASLKNLTDDQRAAVRAAVAAAKTPEEVDRLEQQLRNGQIPAQPAPPTGPPPPSAFAAGQQAPTNKQPPAPPRPPPGPPPNTENEPMDSSS